jgi:hypothetical protein
MRSLQSEFARPLPGRLPGRTGEKSGKQAGKRFLRSFKINGKTMIFTSV